MSTTFRFVNIAMLAICLQATSLVEAQTPPAVDQTPAYLKDRGTGIATSAFGTYVQPREFIFYPFYEYYHDRDYEYKPEEFGFVGDQDFRGRYRANEGILFLAYGISDKLAFEMEVATIKASLEKSPADSSALPRRSDQSGLGDVEGQLRWRWRKEDAFRPEVFGYAEVVIPHHEKKFLIGTSGVELKFGTGIIRGFSWGTMTFRAAAEYAQASTSKFDIGEYAVEYLKRISPTWRVYLGIEGTQDEVSFIPELQLHLGRHAFLKFNSGVGLTPKSIDWAPEVGLGFTFGGQREN